MAAYSIILMSIGIKQEPAMCDYRTRETGESNDSSPKEETEFSCPAAKNQAKVPQVQAALSH